VDNHVETAGRMARGGAPRRVGPALRKVGPALRKVGPALRKGRRAVRGSVCGNGL